MVCVGPGGRGQSCGAWQLECGGSRVNQGSALAPWTTTLHRGGATAVDVWAETLRVVNAHPPKERVLPGGAGELVEMVSWGMVRGR
jgi:hypothetical protein